MNARLAIERSEELKVTFLNQAKSNAEAHNRDLLVEIERLKKSFFKMYGLSACTIEELVSDVIAELSKAKKDAKQTDMKTIEECLLYIEKQIGLKLQICDHFSGIKDLKGKKYFNVILKDPTSESVDFTKLTKLSNLYKKIKVEPNGLRRAAIFIN